MLAPFLLLFYLPERLSLEWPFLAIDPLTVKERTVAKGSKR